MNNQQLHGSFSELSTSLIADACLRLSITLRPAPAGIQPILERSHIAGPQRLDGRAPEALRSARFGDVNVTAEDIVFADADGVLFAPADKRKKSWRPLMGSGKRSDGRQKLARPASI